MENYIVAALTVSLPKNEQCIVVKEDEVIIATHSKVFGPDSKEACDKWAAENCGQAANPNLPVNPKPPVAPDNSPDKALRPRVYNDADAKVDPNIRPDGYLQKIVKYVPSEIVAAYVAIANLLAPMPGAPPAVETKPAWYVFWGLLVLSPIYTYVFTSEKGKPRPIYQTIVAPIAFAAWVIALEGPVSDYFRDKTHLQAIGMIILIGVYLLILLAEQIYLKLTEDKA